MKKTAAILVAAVLLAGMAPARADAGGGHHGAGAFIAGIIGGTILGTALSNAYAYPAPVYAPPPRAYYPPERIWVPGHYESRFERRWVPGHWEVERRGRGWDDFDDDTPGFRARRIWIPGHYERVEVGVWIPGHWEERG